MSLQPLTPIATVELLPELHETLVALLRSLSPAQWEQPTSAVPWTVRDMVAHLLDTDIRRLAFQRDGLAPRQPAAPPGSHAELVAFLDQLNADWVLAAQRISPALLIAFLELTGPQVYQLLRGLDPAAPAFWPVAWAGQGASPNWFDIAREYTEKWHHQQHIREAVGAPLLNQPHWLAPALETFLRALPHTYRAVVAPVGTMLTLVVQGDAGGAWTLRYEATGWQLYHGAAAAAQARVTLDQDVAWRLFTKGLDPAVARRSTQLDGDAALGAHLLQLLAIMA